MDELYSKIIIIIIMIIMKIIIIMSMMMMMMMIITTITIIIIKVIPPNIQTNLRVKKLYGQYIFLSDSCLFKCAELNENISNIVNANQN